FEIAAARPLPNGGARGHAVALEAERPAPRSRGSAVAPPLPTSDTEFRHGWPAVLACFCVAVFAWGFGFYGQSVFLAQLHRMHGWPTSTIGAATTVCYLCGALLIPFIHHTLDRVGPRTLLTAGVLLMGLGAAGFC